MKKSLRKTGALIISMVMLLAIGGTVMADADMSGEGGVIGEFGTPDNNLRYVGKNPNSPEI